MHELSVAQSIISIAENAAPKTSNTSITSIHLQIGELSGIELEPLRFAFSVIKKDTLLENAELDIELIRGEAQCPQCKTEFKMHYYGASCPNCGNYFIHVTKGREMKVVNLVVDEHEPAAL
jgi:hydrogenase nickel incorporation protein HypA/HybF